MGSVNLNARVTLPMATPPADAAPAPAEVTPSTGVGNGVAGWSPGEGISAMGGSFWSSLTDAAATGGWNTREDGTLRTGFNLEGMAAIGAVATAPTAVMALRNRENAVSGKITPYLDSLGTQAATNSMRISPTLVSAILGPAIADGVTMIAPNLVKKYKDTKDIKDAAVKKQTEADNQNVKIGRAAAGGVAVGIAAGVVFLLKPTLFKKFQMLDGSGLVDRALAGTTHYSVNGVASKLTGVLDIAQIKNTMTALGRPLLDTDAVQVLKTVSPMAKDAAFSNRAILGSAGGLGTLLLANHAAGEEDPGRRKMMLGLTAAAGALTIGATYGIGKLTQGSIAANGGAGGLLSKNELLMKPNVEWIKKYAGTIAPITAVPAGTAASQYFNIVNDFDDITSARSPFRK